MALARTPLHETHRRLGARMVPFAGWEMPVQYKGGIISEHSACRNHAAIFDVSHMGEAWVTGPKALDFLQQMTVNDVSRLSDGQAQYSMLLNASGGVVDDILVYRVSADRYFLCLNASRTAADLAHLESRLITGAELKDVSAETGLIAVQGPNAAVALARIAPGVPLGEVKSFHFVEADILGARVMISRTGYTGEDGFEMFCPRDHAPVLWQALAAQPEPPEPAGLGARDTLRLEAGLMLYGHELDADHNPLEAGLDRWIALGAKPFLGSDRLEAAKRDGLARRLGHWVLKAPGVLRDGCAIYAGDTAAGKITSGGFSPTLRQSIGMGYVDASLWESTDPWSVEIRGKRLPVERANGPFYRRPRPKKT